MDGRFLFSIDLKQAVSYDFAEIEGLNLELCLTDGGFGAEPLTVKPFFVIFWKNDHFNAI